MPILWKDAMSVGNATIDNEHKHLFSLINDVEAELKHGGDHNTLRALFEKLEAYTRLHFRREEALQIKMQYPGYPAHKAEHQQIVMKLAGIRHKLLDDQPAPDATLAVEDIMAGELEPPETGAEDFDALLDFSIKPASPRRPSSEVKHEVITMLRDWILNHVLQTDRAMTKHLAAYARASR